MVKRASFDTRQSLEIVELVNEKDNRPVLTFFIADRKIHSVYQHKIKVDSEVKFRAEYTKCASPYIAAGFAMATQNYAKPVNIYDVPAELRVAVLNSLPEQSCSDSIPLDPDITTIENKPSVICDPTEISLCPVTELGRISTEKNSPN